MAQLQREHEKRLQEQQQLTQWNFTLELTKRAEHFNEKQQQEDHDWNQLNAELNRNLTATHHQKELKFRETVELAAQRLMAQGRQQHEWTLEQYRSHLIEEHRRQEQFRQDDHDLDEFLDAYNLTSAPIPLLQRKVLIKADTCNTYNHPQYGIGQCIDVNQCHNALYQSGLCESQPANIKCCFSTNPIKEEFRAAWIATVANIDWPSSRTATPTEQQAELINILNTVQRLNMNGVVFQIRPVGDALYASTLEPWSLYLTGTHGKAPSPLWDPLTFITTEAHKRNIEVHAWLNPYRARMSGATYELASNHMAKRFPKYAYTYNKYIWMDPGSIEVQQFIVNVTEDIVRRYAVDGIHMDDYFYPYNDGTEFPDAETYRTYQQTGGKLNKDDWRRSSVNNLIQTMYTRIHAVKPKVKFGISPFGIWKNGVPQGITGLSSYDSLYCDSRMWLEQGLVDYLTPQLYWQIDPPAQSYPVLLNWWIQQSKKGRHVYPGNAVYRILPNGLNWPVTEIVRQINITRSMHERLALGNVFYSVKQIMQNVKGIQTELATLYKQKVAVPKMNWL
ncbi:unnamed protein product [Rotaria sordida]|uniref:Glycosyl hydrolase-like 10 domain-containing protein n=1 Tax=Rotaria sordida TaxID=392033 RepID=A0A814EJS8_9BILA|nr:unnamed protein product [Rotaria sordida]